MDIHKPELIPFPSENPDAAAVLILPGGGYGFLAVEHEGRDIAAWLNARGIDAYMLKYSIVGPDQPAPLLHAPLQQARAAANHIRQKFAPRMLGAWGFSAGGHLCATLATSTWEGPGEGDCSLDLHILSYPVITMMEATHGGSRANLLGPSPTSELAREFSAEKRVTRETSPCFLFHTFDDAAVPIENALLYIQALRANGVLCEAHLYESGPHGVGLAPEDAVLSSWSARLEDWLRRRGAIAAAST